MVEVMRRRRRKQRGQRERIATAAQRYARMGWPVCPAAHPRPAAGRACSCDRIGCPAPGAHPISPAWQLQASTDLAEVERWWLAAPQANVILVTGRVFDVLDVPAPAGLAALEVMRRSGVSPGPVALTAGTADAAGERALFFVSTRGALATEDEWWSCHLDCIPDNPARAAGLRWHCRDSYVLAPPSRYGGDQAARWVLDPAGRPLPDAVRLLEYLADSLPEVDT